MISAARKESRRARAPAWSRHSGKKRAALSIAFSASAIVAVPHPTDDFLGIGGIHRLKPDHRCARVARAVCNCRALLRALGKALAILSPRKIDRRLVAKSAPISRGMARQLRLISAFAGCRRLDQTVDSFFLGVGLAQKRSIGGVLHQPANQICNARQQFAHRQINPHALAVLDDRLAHRLGHAVEHLDLVTVGRNAELLRRDDGVGQAAQVVAAEGGVDDVVAFEQNGSVLVVRIGFRFVQENRDRPALLLGPGDLAVPVGALDQAHADPPFCRRAQRITALTSFPLSLR